jgi:hypothetical protein
MSICHGKSGRSTLFSMGHCNNTTTTANTMPLRIIVVGAGIAGLALATYVPSTLETLYYSLTPHSGLARKGHHVTVYERRVPAKQDESGSGIQLQPNVAKILEAWDMMDEIKDVT